MKILHRDLKSANVFLNKDGTVKLGDLNVSKVAKMGLVHTQTGTPYYASPEVWEDKSYDFKSDIWSLGVCTYEMATLKPPFTASSMQDLYKRVLSGKYPKIPTEYSRDLTTLIATLLKVKPSQRPSCEQIIHMPAVEEHLNAEDENEINQELLNTIKIPRNINLLKGKLPASQYEDEKLEEMDNVDALLDAYDHKYNLNSGGHSSSAANIIEKPHVSKGDYIKSNLPSTTTNKDNNDSVLREIRSRHGQDPPEGPMKKKIRKNPRTTPMNPELVSIKPKNKYQMYRNLNSQSRKTDLSDMSNNRSNYKNISEKYMKRAQEIEQQEKKLKNELQNRVDDDLPHIYKKSRVGVQRVAYDPRYEGNRDYLKSSHKYGSESENTRKPALMMAPRIVSHGSKESISSRGNIVSESVSPVNKNKLGGIVDHKLHPYKNDYSAKSYKLNKLKGLPPSSSKYSGKLGILMHVSNKLFLGTSSMKKSKANLLNLRAMNVRNKRNDSNSGMPSIRDASNDSYSHMSKEPNRPAWWG